MISLIKRIFFAFFILVMASTLAEAAPAEFKGYRAASELIRTRLLTAPVFELGTYIGEPYGGSLTELLGTYEGSGPSGKLRNGQPNATNMLLWHLVLGGFAQDLASHCTDNSESKIALDDSFRNLLKQICDTNSSQPLSEAQMMDFWFYLMGYEADQQEYEFWRNFVLNERPRLSNQDLIRTMTLTVLNNPYFLLR